MTKTEIDLKVSAFSNETTVSMRAEIFAHAARTGDSEHIAASNPSWGVSAGVGSCTVCHDAKASATCSKPRLSVVVTGFSGGEVTRGNTSQHCPKHHFAFGFELNFGPCIFRNLLLLENL